ncbi:MAG: Aspartate carbamoyltransferase [Candidatus Thorarchaeota archaeon]|nr:MAG: Aspartate carbamoyltransferase [Candidatus Thorarchaeota archaeon]
MGDRLDERENWLERLKSDLYVFKIPESEVMLMGELHNLISIHDLSRENIDMILERAKKMENVAIKRSKDFSSKIMACLFFEASTRTRLSFESAMIRLGGRVLGFADVAATSAGGKGETLADTIRTVERYADIIVMRHPLDGSARVAAEFSNIPIINAGSGSEEHPTQALLDLYSIMKMKGNVDGLTISLCGDLKYGRTVHSLGMALACYDVKVKLAAPESLRMKPAIIEEMQRAGIQVQQVDTLEDAIEDVDVVYMTRIQKERFPDTREYDAVKGKFRLTMREVDKMKDDSIILHPLPRVDEISSDVDSTPHARYFDQVYNGVVTRMAILDLILG